MGFKEWLISEMPLAAYRTSFTNDTSEEEGFGKIGGKKSTERQVYKDESGIEVDIEGRFSKKDRAVLSNPKTLKTLERRLALTGYKFNIVMFEGDAVWGSGRAGRWEQQADDFLRNSGLKTDDHITFVKNGTSGHVMTPWMILHTLGHAVMNSEGEYFREDLSKIIADLKIQLCGTRHPESDCMRRIGEIFPFASAQESAGESASYLNINELYHEFIAEYLWNGGQIRVKPENDRPKIRKITDRIETVVDEMLARCKGKTIYDHLG